MIKSSKYLKLNSAHSFYLIITKINGYFEQSNGNEYSTLVPTNESKGISMKNYGAKKNILSNQKLITRKIMVKNVWKLNLIWMKISI